MKIAEGLKAATGRPWSVVYEQEWFTPNVECQQSGRGDGKETEGLAFLARGRSALVDDAAAGRPDRAHRQMAGGRRALPVTVTHLASGGRTARRASKEVEALLKWVGKLGDSQVVLGDFNLKPEEPALQPMLTMFRMRGESGAEARTASGVEGTSGDRRIDFVFYKGDRLHLDRRRDRGDRVMVRETGIRPSPSRGGCFASSPW